MIEFSFNSIRNWFTPGYAFFANYWLVPDVCFGGSCENIYHVMILPLDGGIMYIMLMDDYRG